MGIYEAYQIVRYGKLIAWPQWADLLSKWNHFMLAVNSSINIIIYVIRDFKFRSSLSALLSTKKFPTIRRSGNFRPSSWQGSNSCESLIHEKGKEACEADAEIETTA